MSIFWKIFHRKILPAHTIPKFCGGIEKTRYYMDNHPDAIENMLKAFVQTELQPVDACMDAGADGFFFATRYSNGDILSEEERFTVKRVRELTRKILIAKDISFPIYTLLLICGKIL